MAFIMVECIERNGYFDLVEDQMVPAPASIFIVLCGKTPLCVHKLDAPIKRVAKSFHKIQHL